VRPMYYAYYRGVAPLAEPASELFFHGGHIGYLMPMEPELDCLVLDIQADEFEQFRSDPEAQFEAAIRRLPGMAPRLETARREGPVYGTRGVDNYMRVPSGPGWVLTGDAGVCKDPSTGTGIMDAFTQSFLLAEALGATLDGADWETAMADYHRRRDAAVSSSYRSALAFAREGEVPAESLGWLQGVLASPGLVRLLAKSFPTAARTPDVFPPGVLRSLERTVGVSTDALSTSLHQRRAA